MGRNSKKKTGLASVVPAGTFGKIGSTVGGDLGKFAGDFVGLGGLGRKAGGDVGSAFGKAIAKLVGFGDYRVANNSIADRGGAIPAGVPVPAFGTQGHAVSICHREYIRDVVVPAVPADFTLESYRINPGLTAMFPWLSGIARNFQQYRILGMVVEFRSLSSDISVGGSLGSVTLATNYNAVGSTYGDKLHMDNSEYAVSAKPSCSQIHSVECDPRITSNTLKYVRGNSGSDADADVDPRLYDMGLFQIATQGLPGAAGTTLGELWVSYHIELYKPLLNDSADDSGQVTSNAFSIDPAGCLTDGYQYGDIVEINSNNGFRFLRGGTYYLEISVDGVGVAFSDNGASFADFEAHANITDSSGTSRVKTHYLKAEFGDSFVLDTTTCTSLSEVIITITPCKDWWSEHP